MDNLKDTLQNYWKGHLIRFNRNQLDQLDITEENKEILEHIGLPEITIELAMFFKVDEKLKRIESSGAKFIVLGNNVGDFTQSVFVCIKESSSEIYQVHTKFDRRGFFMNSNLKSFLLFMHAYSQFLINGQNFDEDDSIEINEMIDKLRETFLQIDPKALSGDNYYWVLTLIDLQAS